MTKDTRRAFASVFWFTLALVATPTALLLAWHRPLWGLAAIPLGLLAVTGVVRAAEHARLMCMACFMGYVQVFVGVPLALVRWAWPYLQTLLR